MRNFMNILEYRLPGEQDFPIDVYFNDCLRGLTGLQHFPQVANWLEAKDVEKGLKVWLKGASRAKVAQARQSAFQPTVEDLDASSLEKATHGSGRSVEWEVWRGQVEGCHFYFVLGSRFSGGPEHVTLQVPADCRNALGVAQAIGKMFGHNGLNEWVETDEEDETPSEREAYVRQQNIENAVKQFCQKECGWDMDGSYAVMFDADSNTLSISPEEGEFTLAQLNKLAVLGEVTINAAARQWQLEITIKTPPGFNITPQA